MKELIFWIVIVLLLIVVMILIEGCQPQPERITKEQWLVRYKPETIEQGQAMAILQGKLEETKAKATSLRAMDAVKMYCLVGAGLSLFAAIFFKMKLLGGAGVAACLFGFCLAYAGTEVPRWLAYIGLAYSVVVGCCGGYILVRAFREVVEGGEEYKRRMAGFSDSRIANFENAHRKTQKHDSTKKLVKKIKAKL